MSELSGRTILIVVASEINQFVWGLQEEVERTGAKTTVAFGAPEATDAVAAIVSVEQQAVLSSMKIPVVVYYEGDTPEQIVVRLRRVLRIAPDSEGAAVGDDPAPMDEAQPDVAAQGRWSTRRGMVTLVVLLFLTSIAAAVGVRFLLIYAFGWG